MPSEAQISANRRNAKLSTGPRTQAGRARSSMNACKSGIYAQSAIIPGEDPAELEALTSRIYDSLQPSPEETALVDQLIGADWQFRRLRRAEADTWTMSITGDREANRKKGLPEDTNIYYRAIEDNKDTFDRIYRLQASTARILNRSLETLLRIRKLDLLHPAEQNEPNLGGAGASAPPPGFCPAQSGPETNPIQTDSNPDPTPPENDETNPISEPPSAEAAADPQPPTSDLRPSPGPSPQSPAPVQRGFRYYNGHRIPVPEIRKS
jgi:hypothetical protein